MAQSQEFGAFLPTTDDFDVEAIYQLDIDPKLQDLIIRLYQSYNDIANITNIKDSGYYLPTEFVTGQQWFADPSLSSTASNTQTVITRQVYRQVVDFGALPNAGSRSVAHNIEGISSETSFTRIYGAATNPTALEYIPLPFVHISGSHVEVKVNATDVTIRTGGIDYSAYTTSYIVLEYLKS
jgi:hypothetical protein